MASNNTSNSKSSNTAKRRNRTPGSRGSLLNNLAFYAVIFDANISTTATGILTQIALAIAIGITVIASYHVARSKGKKMFIVWLVSAILVALSYVLGITLI